MTDPKKVTPLSREKIVQWIHRLSNDIPDIEISDCETCSKIPDAAAADMTEGESLDEYKSKLEIAVHFEYHPKESAMRCPICGRFYLHKYELAGSNLWWPFEEENEYLNRVKIDDVIKLVDIRLNFPGYTKIMTCGNILKII